MRKHAKSIAKLNKNMHKIKKPRY